MRYLLFAIFLLAGSKSGFSQNLRITDSSRQFPVKYSIYFNLLYMEPGIQYNIGNGFVGRLSINPGLNIIEYPSYADRRFAWRVNPGVFYELAYYPWVKKRNAKNRNMDNFSGLFIAACGKTAFNREPASRPLYENVTPVIAITPGLRYSFARYGDVHLQIGPAVSHYSYDIGIYAYGEAGLGFFLSVGDSKK